MDWHIAKLLSYGVFGACAWALKKWAAAQPIVYSFPTDDPELQAAIDHARETLPSFWERKANPGPDVSDFSVKVDWLTAKLSSIAG